MKRQINTTKIKELLKEQKKTQKKLADSIGYSEPNLSIALKGNRDIPMGFVFAVADFFKVDPESITLPTKE